MPLLPRPPAHPSLVVDLARIVGAQNVSTSDADRLAYGRDAWPRDLLRLRAGQIPAAPICVVWPESPDEVARVLALAERVQVPVVPYGAGSGVAGGARPSEGGISLDLKRMRAIRRLVPNDLTLEVEAGIIGERLERQLNQRGFTLGHFPSSIVCSTLGGWLAARSAGQMSTLYGKIEDMALALEVATPGRVRRQESAPRPGAGLDMNALLIGSEGTLGVITAAELRVRPLPPARDLRGYRFPDVKAGIEAIRRMLRAGLRPSVVRLYDALDTVLGRGHGEDDQEASEVRSMDALSKSAERALAELSRRVPGLGDSARLADRLRRTLVKATVRSVLGAPLLLNRALEALPEECLLVLGIEGQPALVAAEAAAARQICEEQGAADLGPGPGEHWLKNRYNVSFKQSKIYASGAFVDTMEVAATWDRLLPLYRSVKRAIGKDAIVMAHFSHAYGEGCSIYFSFAGQLGDTLHPEQALDRYDRIWQGALLAVHEAGGTMSHHHGVGELKAAAMAREHGQGGVRALAGLKAALDPAGVLNPGKLGLEAGRRPLPRSRSRIPAQGRGFPSEVTIAVGERNVFTQGSRTVVRPPDESALAAVLRVVHPHSIPVVSDQSGYRAPPRAVHLDLSRFEGITRLSEHSLFAEVEAGVVVERLERMLNGHQLTLGLVHPRALLRSIGAGAARGLLVRRGVAFGDLSDLVFAVRGLLGNGQPIETRPVPRSATGPELDRLFVGAQGRFGLITKVTLRVAALPAARGSLVFEHEHLDDAVECARLVLQRGVRPLAARVLQSGRLAKAAFELTSSDEPLLRAASVIVASAAAQTGGSRVEEPGLALSGRFDAVVEASVPWSRAAAALSVMRAAGGGEAWLDFLAPEAATVVARVLDAQSRVAAAEAARAAGARVVAGLRPDALEDEAAVDSSPREAAGEDPGERRREAGLGPAGTREASEARSERSERRREAGLGPAGTREASEARSERSERRREAGLGPAGTREIDTDHGYDDVVVRLAGALDPNGVFRPRDS